MEFGLARLQPQVNPSLGSTTGLSEQDIQKADDASQIQSTATGLCEHRSLEEHQHCLHRLSHRKRQCQLQVKHHHHKKGATTSTSAEGKRQSASQASHQQAKQKKTSDPHITNHYVTNTSEAALPAPPPTSLTRERDDTVAEGSTGKQQRTTAERQALEPTTTEQPRGKMRINAIKFPTKDGKQMETASNEDTQEIKNERILLEPIIHDTEGLDPQQVAQGMKKEVQQMKDQSVFTEIDGNTTTPEQQASSNKGGFSKNTTKYEHE